jgi:hypothetical protein
MVTVLAFRQQIEDGGLIGYGLGTLEDFSNASGTA